MPDQRDAKLIECTCELKSVSKSIRPECHADDCTAYAPPKAIVPSGLTDLEVKAFHFYDPEPNWRSELHAEDFAKRAAAFAAEVQREDRAEIDEQLQELLDRANDRIKSIERFSWDQYTANKNDEYQAWNEVRDTLVPVLAALRQGETNER
jgi:hypothetical protein